MKMGDADYEKAYLEKKKKLRILHQKLKDTKDVQEIYHKIMGSDVEDSEDADSKTSD